MANLEQEQYLGTDDQKYFIDLVKSLGAMESSFVALAEPLSIDKYSRWIQDGLHGEMAYLSRHLQYKKNPQLKWPSMNSAMVLLVPYELKSKGDLAHSRTALYSQENDYHEAFRLRFDSVLSAFKKAYPNESFYFATDSAPILERDLAYRAGLGWFGKNSCLIDRKHGSLFLIAEILTSLKVDVTHTSVKDFCGQCRRCIDNCPTDAILENRTLDAKRCISYWTIESKQIAPLQLSQHFNDWLFGCDICQTVCPWNEKSHGKDLMKALSKERMSQSEASIDELRWILLASPEQFKERFQFSPILRSKHHGLKRNALYVIENLRLRELRAEVSLLCEAEGKMDMKLNDLARRVLNKLSSD